MPVICTDFPIRRARQIALAAYPARGDLGRRSALWDRISALASGLTPPRAGRDLDPEVVAQIDALFSVDASEAGGRGGRVA